MINELLEAPKAAQTRFLAKVPKRYRIVCDAISSQANLIHYVAFAMTPEERAEAYSYAMGVKE